MWWPARERCGYETEPTLTLQRYLDDIEVRMMNAAPAQVAEYQGKLDREGLTRAFELLCVKYPVLRGRIRHDGHGYLLYVPPDHYPELVVLDGDVSTLRREANGLWDPARTVAQLILVRRETGGFVALRADHAIVDGRSWTAMFAELWRLYTDIVNGRDVSVEPGLSLPSSPYELLEQRRGGIQSEPSSGPAATPNLPGYFKRLEGRVRLTEEDTSRLIASARAQKTSVHAFVCGAIVVALRDQGESSDPTPIVCLSFIDLRNRVTPPVAATESANLLSIHRATVTVPANANPVEIGREIKTQLDSASARGELRLINPSKVASSGSETSVRDRFATVGVTNLGAVSRFDQPEELTITDWFRVVPTTSQTPTFPVFGVYTYDGRLSLRCNCSSSLYNNEEVKQIIKRTEEGLRQISARLFG